MSTLTPFRPIKSRRKLNLDAVQRVTAQMQGLIDTEPENETAQAFHGLVAQWHQMLLNAVVDEAKRT